MPQARRFVIVRGVVARCRSVIFISGPLLVFRWSFNFCTYRSSNMGAGGLEGGGGGGGYDYGLLPDRWGVGVPAGSVIQPTKGAEPTKQLFR